MTHEINGKRILITGGTGFIGGRLVEILKTGYDVDIRVLVSNFTNVARIARFPVNMIKGNLCNSAEVDRAVEGCDIVFHCAYGNRGTSEEKRRVNVEGTKNILSSCLKFNVKRVVHLSTIMVYGQTPDGEIDETAPYKLSGGAYSDSKIEAEKLVNHYQQKGLSITVLQPTAVYGPYAPVWGVNVLDQMKSGLIMLINDGDGFCNGVYIDDVINAMLLSAVNDTADGETFIISWEYPITWKDFYACFERMLGYSATVEIAEADALAYKAKLETKKSLLKLLREDSEIRSRLLDTPLISSFSKAAASILPKQVLGSLKQKVKGNGRSKVQQNDRVQSDRIEESRPVHPMSDSQIRFFKAKTHFRIDKARKLLGYKPLYDFDAGMKITALWAESANLLEKESQQVK